MTNKITEKAGLILNANKTKKRICSYYSNFKIKSTGKKSSNKKSNDKKNKKSKKKTDKKSKTKDVNKPLFRGGSTTFVFLTSIIEQLIVSILVNSSKGLPIDKESDQKVLRRSKIIDHIKGNKALDVAFYKALKYHDTDVDYSDESIMTDTDLTKILKKYLPHDIILTAEAIMFVKYVAYHSLNSCIKMLAIVRKSSTGKSIVLNQVISCVKIFIDEGELFTKIKEKADVCVEKVEKYENSQKEKKSDKKGKKKGGNKKKNDSDSEEEDSDSGNNDSDDSSDGSNSDDNSDSEDSDDE